MLKVLTEKTMLKLSYLYSYDEAQNKEGWKLKQPSTNREWNQLHINIDIWVLSLMRQETTIS